jgi:cytoskeletal protein CcmA (bactofilin family)
MGLFGKEPEKKPSGSFFWRGQDRQMASFSEEPDKNSKPQVPQKPQAQASTAVNAPSPSVDSRGITPRVLSGAHAMGADGRAFLDKGCKINGKVSFEGPAQIDGQVEGEISGSDTIMIGESAVLNAQVRAETIVIAGKIAGDIVAGQRVEIQPSARVVGNLTAPILVIHEGALFKGHCSMQVEGVRDERRTPIVNKDERLGVSAQSKPV